LGSKTCNWNQFEALENLNHHRARHRVEPDWTINLLCSYEDNYRNRYHVFLLCIKDYVIENFVHVISKALNLTLPSQGVMRVRKRVTKMVLTVSVIYGMCWIPNLTIYALNYFSPSQNYGDVTYITSIVLVTCNSTVNPFIYVFVNQKFRRKIKNLVCCCQCHNNRVDISNDATVHTTGHINTIAPPTIEEDVGVGGESNREPTGLLE